MIEALESRQCCSVSAAYANHVLTIVGTPGNDDIVVEGYGDNAIRVRGTDSVSHKQLDYAVTSKARYIRIFAMTD